MTERPGTGQGSVISPLFANIYLHYVLDLWANRWRRREATGARWSDAVIVALREARPDALEIPADTALEDAP